MIDDAFPTVEKPVAETGSARVFIYTLADPRDGMVRYVGKSINLEKRLKKHLYAKENGHKANWIASLKKLGLKPIMEAIEEIKNPTEEQWQEAERYWIESLRCLGFKLTNLVAGGYGMLRPSAETIEKVRAKLTGRFHSAETKLKMRNSALGKISPIKGIKFSEEHKLKIKMALTGKKKSPEHVQKLIKAKTGIKRSIESRIKQSKSLKSLPETNKIRAREGLKIGREFANTPEAIRKKLATRRASNRGAWHSLETIAKIKAKAILRVMEGKL